MHTLADTRTGKMRHAVPSEPLRQLSDRSAPRSPDFLRLSVPDRPSGRGLAAAVLVVLTLAMLFDQHRAVDLGICLFGCVRLVMRGAVANLERHHRTA